MLRHWGRSPIFRGYNVPSLRGMVTNGPLLPPRLVDIVEWLEFRLILRRVRARVVVIHIGGW